MDAFLKMGERRERGTGGDKSGDLRVGEGDDGAQERVASGGELLKGCC